MYRRVGLLAISSRYYIAVTDVYLLTLLASLICLRSWVFLWFPQAHLDSDQAVFGLMAKDIALGRDFPVFTYGRRYMLAVGAWLCAPLVALFGMTITTLKLPMFAMNVGCVFMLWFGLRRERGLGRWGVTLAIMPFAAAGVVVASRLVEHAGGNIEPLFFLLLAYVLRNRPVSFGLVLGIAFLNREFAPIGLIALVLMDIVQGSWRPRVRLYGTALGIAAAW
jgi:uncharacterized membrane protein